VLKPLEVHGCSEERRPEDAITLGDDEVRDAEQERCKPGDVPLAVDDHWCPEICNHLDERRERRSVTGWEQLGGHEVQEQGLCAVDTMDHYMQVCWGHGGPTEPLDSCHLGITVENDTTELKLDAGGVEGRQCFGDQGGCKLSLHFHRHRPSSDDALERHDDIPQGVKHGDVTLHNPLLFSRTHL